MVAIGRVIVSGACPPLLCCCQHLLAFQSHFIPLSLKYEIQQFQQSSEGSKSTEFKAPLCRLKSMRHSTTSGDTQTATKLDDLIDERHKQANGDGHSTGPVVSRFGRSGC